MKLTANQQYALDAVLNRSAAYHNQNHGAGRSCACATDHDLLRGLLLAPAQSPLVSYVASTPYCGLCGQHRTKPHLADCVMEQLLAPYRP